jgi:hypothetical protein
MCLVMNINYGNQSGVRKAEAAHRIVRRKNLNKLTFRFERDPELPACITPVLGMMKIRICTEGYPAQGAVYYEGTVRTFVIERLPQEELVQMLPQLLEKPKFTYCFSKEVISVERI